MQEVSLSFLPLQKCGNSSERICQGHFGLATASINSILEVSK